MSRISNVSTSAISFVETEHGRERRRQRGIDKKNLQRAKKYGARRGTYPRANGDKCSRYEYKGITYITNDVTGEEITCYCEPLQLEPVPVTEQMKLDHVRAHQKLQTNLNTWTSNTVMVIDVSGSMREADVWGTRNRLGAVWVSVALDFLAHRIETGSGKDSDVLSVVTLSDSPKVVVREEPCTWVLYNKLVAIYSNNQVPPFGHGPFLPALKIANQLLLRNSNASCALALTLLSDGKPSDAACGGNLSYDEWNTKIVSQVGDLARQFGRRLTFAAIGIGDMNNFAVLESMVEAAKDYNANAIFQLPSMTSTAIGAVFTSVATSVTTTQTEMTDVATKVQRQVRQVNRVSKSKAQQSLMTLSAQDFWIYRLDNVEREVYIERVEENRRTGRFVSANLQHKDAAFVAFERGPFGEGAERFAYRFYELGRDMKTVLGKALVAKENRLIYDDDEANRKQYVKIFCKTQQLAGRLAEEFNQKVKRTHRIHSSTPRVQFLDCSVYKLDDNSLGRVSVLVEDRIDETKWQKWNANNGYVAGMEQAPVFSEAEIADSFAKLTNLEDLDMIEEGSEEEESDEEEEVKKEDRTLVFSAFEVAQAFSHFSYWASGRKRLVCDLQGVYDEEAGCLRLSDPVIHYHNKYNTTRTQVHGRTDRGWKGMSMFFDTHKEHCGHLCKLMLRGIHRRRRPGPR